MASYDKAFAEGQMEDLERLSAKRQLFHDQLELCQRSAHQYGLATLFDRVEFPQFYQEFPPILCTTCDDDQCHFNLAVSLICMYNSSLLRLILRLLGIFR